LESLDRPRASRNGIIGWRLPGDARWFYEVPLSANETTDLGDIPLYRHWWVSGRVVAADTGEPLAATITTQDGVAATTDPDGNFVLTMDKDARSCRLKIVPMDKAWQERAVGSFSRGDPTVEVGDIVLQPSSPE
jgi:hypothetical protein